tara:strand:- start:151 stop:360 length:210 start_codon:yes stop_codon:yes gene_type:complete
MIFSLSWINDEEENLALQKDYLTPPSVKFQTFLFISFRRLKTCTQQKMKKCQQMDGKAAQIEGKTSYCA